MKIDVILIGKKAIRQMENLERFFPRMGYMGYRYLHLNYPWLTSRANTFLLKNLSPHMRAFEWGSGSSTKFFAQRISFLTSIEHDKAWYEKVKKKLEKCSVTNVEYKYFPPVKTGEKSDEKRDSRETMHPDEMTNPKEFRNYINAIEPFADEAFDFIVVDGRARCECVEKAMKKLKIGGMILVDDMQRPWYRPITKALSQWKRFNFKDSLKMTSIWIKHAG